MNNERVHLLFTGNGELEAQLKSISKSNRLVHFVDFQNQSYMPIVYQSADLFCLPSKGPNETWGLAVNEAMAAGKAVLVSDKVGCAQDLVKENGRIFTSGNLESLYNCLLTLTLSKENLKLMGNKSTEIIRNYTFSKQVEIIEKAVI